MKSIAILLLTMLLLLTCIANVKSQVTINSPDYASIGDTIILGVDTVPPMGITTGGTGTQTWDYTNLQADSSEMHIFVHPGSTPAAADFAGSNLAYGDDPVYYQRSSMSGVTVNGYAGQDPLGVGLQVSVVNDPAHHLIEFPSTNGSTFFDTSAYSSAIETSTLGLPVQNLDSLRVHHYSYISSAIDAFGPMSTPSGTYNSLRQHYTEETIDSVFAYCSDPADCNVFITVLPFGWSFVPDQLAQLMLGQSNPEIDMKYSYRWWANGEDQPVVELTMDSVNIQVVAAKYKIGAPAKAFVASLSNVLCAGDCNGTAKVLGNDANPPYTYLWDDPGSQTDSVATGLCAAIYNVRVINAVSDTVFISLTIGTPDTLTAWFSTTVDSGGGNGSITCHPSGGAAPYSYNWSVIPLQTTQTVTGLQSGTYFVTVTDGNGCTYMNSAVVMDAGCSISVSFYVSNASVCEGESVVFTNTSIGNPANEWQVDGLPFANSTDALYTFDSSGVYTVSLLGANGVCSDSSGQMITVNPNPPVPGVTVLGNAFSCDIAGVSYQWFLNSDTIPGATSQVYVGSETGFYMVIVVDNNGCSSSSSNFGFTGNAQIDAKFEITITPNPGSGEITIKLNALEHAGLSVKLFHASGRLIYAEDIRKLKGGYSHQIDLSGSAKGMYYLQVVTVEGVMTRKILLIH